MKKVLTIAGSDTSGGAGIQADLKTFRASGVYGMTAQTVIVTMDPHDNWSHNIFPMDIAIVKAQLETIVAGIGVDAMKTGMLPSTDIIELAAFTVKKHGMKNVVVDPVMVCKGAGEPIHPENAECYKKTLVPLASVVTPNVFEASQLSGIKAIETLDDMKEAARIIKELGAGCVVIKGGKTASRRDGCARPPAISVDVVYDGRDFKVLESERIDTTNTHGAGCTFSAAIAAQLAKGAGISEAVIYAKGFVAEAIRSSFKLNQFVGTLGF